MMHLDTIKREIEKSKGELGRCNLLIAGRTGVGKSTLINSIFHGRVATTGQGKPVTKAARFVFKEGVPLGIWDTRGLEMADFKEALEELVQLVDRKAADPDLSHHIHVAYLCLHEDGRRVQTAERDLCRKLAQHMPVLGVITKARNDEGFRAEVQRLLPEARNVVRVRAITETLDDGHKLQPMGLEDLIEVTMGLVPEGIRRAFGAVQRVSLRHKRQLAHRTVFKSAGMAAVTAATPIPFADAAVLVPIQLGMLVRVSVLYGFDITEPYVKELVAAAIGPTAATAGGRVIVANLLKLSPGAGTMLGGAISAATAATLTAALGGLYIAALDAAFAKSGSDSPDLTKVAAELRNQAKNAKGDTQSTRIRAVIRKLWPFSK